MKPRHPFPEELPLLLQRQAGVATWAQVQALGVTRPVFRRLTRDWPQLARGLYCSIEPIWESAMWAGLLRGAEGSVIGGQSAAFQHGLTLRRPDHVTVWTPPGRRYLRPMRVGPWSVVFRQGLREAGSLALPVVNLDDLLPELASEGDTDAFINAVLAAIQAGKVAPDAVARLVDGSPRRAQQDLVARVTTAAVAGVESILEWRFLTAVEQPHALPQPQRQVWTSSRSRVDVLYEEYSTILELDGGQHDQAADARRDNSHAVNKGYVSLRYPGVDVFRRPCAIARELGQVLVRKGWTSRVQPCAACIDNW